MYIRVHIHCIIRVFHYDRNYNLVLGRTNLHKGDYLLCTTMSHLCDVGHFCHTTHTNYGIYMSNSQKIMIDERFLY